MSLATASVAAATAVVGYDLLQDSIHAQSQVRRVIKSIGVAGSAAALDTIVEVYVGNQSIGRFFNNATGAVQVDSGMFAMNAPVGPGAKVVARVTDAPASNPINIVVDFAP